MRFRLPIAMLVIAAVWWVIPYLIFVVVSVASGQWSIAAAVLLLFACAGLGSYGGVTYARYRRADTFEGALNGALCGILISAVPIASKLL
jgi:hypothetical protein